MTSVHLLHAGYTLATAVRSVSAPDGTASHTVASGEPSAAHGHLSGDPWRMSTPTRRRRIAATRLAASLLMLSIAACAAPAPSPPASQAPPSPSASADPEPAIDVGALLGDAVARDGQIVRVRGNFLADEQSAELCAVLLESYPPQCGGGVQVTGVVPSDALNQLSTTSEPGLKKAWWGFVTLVGTFRASGADGRPTIELGEILLKAGFDVEP